MRKQLMAWMEHGLQISLKRYALNNNNINNITAGAFGCAIIKLTWCLVIYLSDYRSLELAV